MGGARTRILRNYVRDVQNARGEAAALGIGVSVTGGEALIVKGNHAEEIERMTATSARALQIALGTTNLDRLYVTDNTFHDALDGLAFVGTGSPTSITVAKAVFRRNTFAGVAGTITNVAGHTFTDLIVSADNDGLANTARGTAQITSGNTSVQQAHGLDVTPGIEDVVAVLNSSLGSAVSWWVSAVDATNITLNVDSNPGATVNFSWRVDAVNQLP